MPLIRTALIATAACLIGAAAYAQPTTTDQAPPAGDSQSMPQAAPDTGAPPAATPDTGAAPSTGAAMPDSSTGSSAPMPDNSGAMNATPGAAQVGTPANTSTTVDANGNQVVASQPVPDTKANRAAYGAPLSHAGKHTAPAGN